jgi:hypothetical protein
MSDDRPAKAKRRALKGVVRGFKGAPSEQETSDTLCLRTTGGLETREQTSRQRCLLSIGYS